MQKGWPNRRGIAVLAMLGAACGGGARTNPGAVVVPAQPAQPAGAYGGASAPSGRTVGAVAVGPGSVAAAGPLIARLSTAGPMCGLDGEGRVWRWGTGEIEPDAPSIRGARSIACGMDHACVVAADGSAWCWGSDSYGALGDGAEKSTDEPVRVVGPASVADIGVDFGRTCARTTSGDVFCWGDSEFGKAGDGRLPDNVGREKRLAGKPILAGASSLGVGLAHACSAMTDGRLSCWGQNKAGSCGQPNRVRYVQRPAFVPKSKDIVAVRAGESVTCSLDRQGAVACWGNSASGFLGPSGPKLGETSPPPRDSPLAVPLASPAVEIAVGTDGFACARFATGAVDCWGHNENGQLGDGTTTDRATPAPVKGIAKATRIAAGLSNACALVEGGRVFCWGKEISRKDASSMPDDALVPVEMRPRRRR